MSLLIKKYNGNVHLEITNELDDHMFDVSMANAIRRSLYLTNPCWAIPEKLNKEHKENIYKYFNVFYDLNEKIGSVSFCNYINSQVLSHRLNRMPIYYDSSNEELYKQGLFFCMTSKGDFSKPHVHLSIEPKIIYSNDLSIYTIKSGVPVLLTDIEKNSIIKFNVHLFTLKKDDCIHIMTSPTFNYGYKGSEFEPVTVTYNFGLDAKPDYHRRDAFDNPDNIYIGIGFSGKKSITESFANSITYLSNQVNVFITEYTKALSAGSDVVKIINVDHNMEEIDVVNSDCYLADHTLGNLLSCHVLMYTISCISEFAKDNKDLFHELLSYTLISYLSPDESAITRTLKFKFQLPLNDDFNEFLYKKHKNQLLVKNPKLYILWFTTVAIMKYLQAQL